ncbi:hypothetical protein ONJ95_25810, partial [Salmonella enterica subsp. enterica serovar Virginia]|nr:hypothetical protein [Salmonella enterica subsp. enterica serovar Virginia]
GTTEWVVGPSFNIAVDSLKLWFGAGAFFPVMQEAKSPTKMEDAVHWARVIAAGGGVSSSRMKSNRC